jgi:hypothetical protein
VADNFVANSGSGGDTFGADDIGGVKYPRSKIIIGADGTNDGDVSSANPLPVTGTITAVTNITNAVAVTNAGLTELAAAINANQIDVNIATDSVGIGGGTQYTEDAAAAANPVGNAMIVVRDDARGGSLTTTDGDNVALRGTNAGELYVKHTDSVAVTNGGLTELAAAINASSQMDVNIAASAATVAVSNAGLTELAAAINASSQMDVNIAASNATITVASHAVTNAGTFAVQVDGAALTALQVIDNPVLVDDAAFTPATSSVMMAGFQADETATDSVDEGDAGAARMTLDRKQITTPQPHTAGGLSIFRSLDLDETEEDVKTSAGQIYGIIITNFATTTRHVKFSNATAANTTVGTTAVFMTISVPGNTSDDTLANLGWGGMGIPFDTALCAYATTGLADNDTGAPAANDVSITVLYK